MSTRGVTRLILRIQVEIIGALFGIELVMRAYRVCLIVFLMQENTC